MAFLSEIQVTIDGNPFRDFIQINITQSLYKTGQFSMTCRFDAVENPDSFLIEQSQNFLGKQIVIKTKVKEYNEDDIKDALVFRGIITRITGTKTGMADGNRIVITGSSPDILLDRKPTSRVFLDKNLKDVVNKVLQPYDAMLLNPKVNPRNNQQFSYIVQYEESDLDFLRRLSIRYGEWFYYSGEKLVFGELVKDNLDLVIGLDTQELNYAVHTKPLNFEIYTHDLLNRKDYEISNSSVTVDSDLNSYGKSARDTSLKVYPEKGRDYFEHISMEESNIEEKTITAGELMAKADAVNLTRITGASKNPFVRIGWNGKFKVLKEKERGVTDYGEYTFTEINSWFDNVLNYRNSFSATPSCTSIPENTDPYYVVKVHPQIAVVTDNKDPEKLGRIRVWFIWMTNDESSPWINITSPFVMKSSGFYFIPQVGSNVLIGFETGDIERPFCMGTMFDKTAAPDPAWIGNYNDKDAKIHAIRTPSGNTLEFNDSGGIIHIYDKGNQNRITLDSGKKRLSVHSNFETHITAATMASISLGESDDPSKNKVSAWFQEHFIHITTETGNIEISTDKDTLGIRALHGTIYLQGKTINLDATETLNIWATKINIDGKAVTDIKGGVVKIN